MYLKPSKIRYTQDSISSRFGNHGLYANTLLGESLDDLLIGNCSVHSIPTISVINHNNKWYSSDNRRLWVFKMAEKLGQCDEIPVRETFYLPDYKFTTDTDGLDIDIRGNGPGGRKWKKWRTSYDNRPRHRYVGSQPRVRDINNDSILFGNNNVLIDSKTNKPFENSTMPIQSFPEFMPKKEFYGREDIENRLPTRIQTQPKISEPFINLDDAARNVDPSKGSNRFMAPTGPKEGDIFPKETLNKKPNDRETEHISRSRISAKYRYSSTEPSPYSVSGRIDRNQVPDLSIPAKSTEEINENENLQTRIDIDQITTSFRRRSFTTEDRDNAISNKREYGTKCCTCAIL